MATCKECLHFDVCREVDRLQYRHSFAWYKAQSGCPYFKPAADVQEVRHGEWVPITNGLQGWKCNLCDEHIYVEPPRNPKRYKYPYCPNCGAKMDGKGDV